MVVTIPLRLLWFGCAGTTLTKADFMSLLTVREQLNGQIMRLCWYSSSLKSCACLVYLIDSTSAGCRRKTPNLPNLTWKWSVTQRPYFYRMTLHFDCLIHSYSEFASIHTLFFCVQSLLPFIHPYRQCWNLGSTGPERVGRKVLDAVGRMPFTAFIQHVVPALATKLHPKLQVV